MNVLNLFFRHSSLKSYYLCCSVQRNCACSKSSVTLALEKAVKNAPGLQNVACIMVMLNAFLHRLCY